MSSPYCPPYNYPSNHQMPRSYNAQHSQVHQQYQQYQYDPRHNCYRIMSNDGGKGKGQQPEAESPKSDGASGSAQYYCFYEPCAGQSKCFGRKADLERHIAAIHNRAASQLIDCDHPGCHRRGEYGFQRRDKMIEHMRDVHKAPIPKRGQSSR